MKGKEQHALDRLSSVVAELMEEHGMSRGQVVAAARRAARATDYARTVDNLVVFPVARAGMSSSVRNDGPGALVHFPRKVDQHRNGEL